MDSRFLQRFEGLIPSSSGIRLRCSGVYQRLILLEAVGRIQRLSSHISGMCSAVEVFLVATYPWVLWCGSALFPVFSVFKASIHRHQLELNSSKNADIYSYIQC